MDNNVTKSIWDAVTAQCNYNDRLPQLVKNYCEPLIPLVILKTQTDVNIAKMILECLDGSVKIKDAFDSVIFDIFDVNNIHPILWTDS